MKIGFDFDGVIINSAKLKSRVCEELYHKSIPLELCDSSLLNGLLSAEEYYQVQEESYGNPKYKKFMEEVPDSVKIIKKLLHDGHDIKIVTSRINTKLKLAKEWLINNGLNIDIIGVGEKTSKESKCKSFDIFLEDKPERLLELRDIVPHVYLFEWPYNQRHLNLPRVNSFEQFYNEIQKLEVKNQGLTIWFTGISGSGKTTIANEFAKRIRAQGRKIVILDGDTIRKNLSADLGYTKEERDKHITRVANVCGLITANGILNIACVISPTKEIRDYARNHIKNFVEVYIRCSINTCRERDVKGLYKKVDSGEITEFVGISIPYEEPENPELILDTDKESVNESVTKLINFINKIYHETL